MKTVFGWFEFNECSSSQFTQNDLNIMEKVAEDLGEVDQEISVDTSIGMVSVLIVDSETEDNTVYLIAGVTPLEEEE